MTLRPIQLEHRREHAGCAELCRRRLRPCHWHDLYRRRLQHRRRDPLPKYHMAIRSSIWTRGQPTGTDPYPHAAGGFAYGVINDKLYVAGGRDANLNIINDNYEFDPQAAAGSRYTQKADEPGTFQNNVPGSASAQGVLWVYGGGNPFAAGSAGKALSHSTKASFNPTAAFQGHLLRAVSALRNLTRITAEDSIIPPPIPGPTLRT